VGEKVKSSLWAPGTHTSKDPLGVGILVVEDDGFVILGAPVGSSPYEAEQIRARIREIKEITSLLQHIEDAQIEFVLLRSCFSLPKVIYMLRTVDPTKHQDIWADFDTHIRDALNRILGTNMN
jgi:hypothetical protein